MTERQIADDHCHLKFRIGEFEQMNSRPPKKLKAHKARNILAYPLACTFVAIAMPVMQAKANPLQDQVDTALKTFVQGLEPGVSQKRNEGSWQKLDTRLTLPVCPQPLEVAPFSGRSTGRITVKVSCASPSWNMLVPLTIHAFQQVVVSKAPIARNQAISGSVLAIEEREIKPPLSNFFIDLSQVNGRLAKRAIAPDQILTAAMLKNPDIVSKGQSVIIEAASGNFAIRSAGTALTNGGMGDTIKVRNAQSGRVVEGVIVSEGKIRVAL